MPRIPGRSIRRAAATPAATTRRAYLRHLDRCNEILGARLNTLHNLHFYLDLMRQMRAALDEGTVSPPSPATALTRTKSADSRAGPVA